MNKLKQLLRLSTFEYWHSPTQVICLLVVIVSGIVLGPSNIAPNSDLASSSWSIAGQTFRYAGSLVGFIACIGAASSLQKDRTARRFELLITSGHNSTHYVLSKLEAEFIPLVIAGIILIGLSQICVYINFSLVDPLAFLAAFGIIYLPLVCFSLAFGFLISVTTGSQIVAFILYFLIWSIGVLPLPPVTSLFDVSGESLYVAFFDLSTDSLSYEIYKDRIPLPVWEEAMESLSKQKQYGALSLALFLALSGLFTLASTMLFRRKWNKNAQTLLACNPAAFQPICLPESKTIALLKVAHLRQFFLAFTLILSGSLFIPLTDTSSSIGFFFIEPLLAICVSVIFFSSITYSSSAGINEMESISPNGLFYLGLKIINAVIFTIACLGIQIYLWQNTLKVAPEIIFIDGLTASAFFLALVLLLSSYTKNKTAFTALLTIFWVFLQTPTVNKTLASLNLLWLHPFQLSSTGEISYVSLVILILFILAAIFFFKKAQ